MRIRIHLKIFLFFLLFYFTKQIEIYAMLMIFALIHELGHLVMGLVMGLKPESLTIMPLGISISFQTTCEDYNKKYKKGTKLAVKKLWIAMAGPITNFAIVAILFFAKCNLPEMLRMHMIYANILIGLFNLLPIYPLDGGRILKNILHIFNGLENANRQIHIIAKASIVLLTAISSVAILYFQNIAIVLMLIYLWGLVIKEDKKYEWKNKMYQFIEKG